MIYLDNAATSWPKPSIVHKSVAEALVRFGANPGRGGHRMAMETAERVYACRETAAEFFGLKDPSNVIFTSNCTMALNMVIKGLLSDGGHAVISDMEHNSVVRPLTALAKYGVRYTMANVCEGNPKKTVENFKAAICPDTRLLLCTHASNAFGTVLPIRELSALAHRFGLVFAVDAAQSAGHLPLHMEREGIDFLCVPGHKGLYGPMGTGMLLCKENVPIFPLLEGGTGTRSLETAQPEEFPERMESGTLNVPGICGLHAGLLWVKQHSVSLMEEYELSLIQRLYSLLANTPCVSLYTDWPRKGNNAALLSFNVKGKSSEETAALLAEEGIAVRGGLHCAPCAHMHMQTLEGGTVRVSVSAFTTRCEVDKLHKMLIKISRKP